MSLSSFTLTRVAVFLTLPLALGALHPAAARSQEVEQASTSLAITPVTVIDVREGVARPDRTVVVTGNRITAVGPAASVEFSADTRVVDGAGKFLIPGFINTHIHFMQLGVTPSGERRFDTDAVITELERSLYSGVTAVREAVAGDPGATAALVRQAEADSRVLPDIYFALLAAGPSFFDSDTRPAARTSGPQNPVGEIAGEADIARLVEEAVAVGAAGIKIFSDLPPERVKSIAAAARDAGLQVWGHSTVFPTRPGEVVAAGVGTISHVCGLPWEVLGRVPERMNERPRFNPSSVDLSDPRFAALFAQMRRRGTILDATLSVYTLPQSHAPRRGCDPKLMVELASSAQRAGVPLSTGTDYFNDASSAYPSLHAEVEYLVETGVVSPTEALTALTLNGARAIGIEATHGTIDPGKVADLVILGSDPTQDIEAIRDVVAVLKDGRFYRRHSRHGQRW